MEVHFVKETIIQTGRMGREDARQSNGPGGQGGGGQTGVVPHLLADKPGGTTGEQERP